LTRSDELLDEIRDIRLQSEDSLKEFVASKEKGDQ
jgi:hypothetical protein